MKSIHYSVIAAITLSLGAPSVLAEEATIYDKVIKPILEARCVECHGPDKQKAKLRLDSPEHITDGSDGEAIVAGNAAESLVLERVLLPEDDDEAMPPKGDRLTKEQIETLKWWVDQQKASFEAKFVVADAPDAVKKVAEAGVAASKVAKAKEPELPEVDAADPALMKPLQDAGVLVLPLAQNTNLLHVETVSVSKDIKDDHLAMLEPLAPQLAWLYLNKTQITNDGLKSLAGLKQLRRLHMANTQITDEGLKHLTGLENLETLNIYGTQVTDASLETIAALPKLKKVFLYNTKVSPRTAFRFLNKHPNLDVNLGWDFESLKKLDIGMALHETFEDQHAGEVKGGKIAYGDGPSGKAATFDGKAFVVVGDNANFDRTDPFSVTAWIKGEPQDDGVIAARADVSDAGRGWDLHVGKGRLSFQLVSNGPDNAIKVDIPAALEKDQWYHVAATYDGSGKAAGVRLYLDGGGVLPTVHQDNLSRTTKTYQVLSVGRRSDGAIYKGQIDDLRIYPSSLSADQVGALFDRYGFKEAAKEGEGSTKKSDKVAAVNDKCPFSGQPIDATQTVVYTKAVGVCCEKCAQKLADNPAKFADKLASVKSTHLNKKCPLSGKDVDAAHTVAYKGSKVAFCCPNCPKNFDPAKHADKVVVDNAGNEKCIFSNQDNSEVVFVSIGVGVCCEKCKAKFEKNADEHILKLAAADEKKTAKAEAKPEQPAAKKVVALNDKCPFSGEPIDAAQIVTYTKAVGVCCGKCKGKVEKNPTAIISKLAKVKTGPLNKTCPLSGKKADAAHTVAFKGSTVAFCCPNCPKNFDPAKHASKVVVDNAGNDTCIFSGEENSEVAFVSLAIGVCCGKCKAKFEKNADDHILKVTFPAKTDEGKAAAAAKKKSGEPKTKLVALFDEGSCCHKAHGKGGACKHPCCIKAAAKKVVCLKCNPGAKAKLIFGEPAA